MMLCQALAARSGLKTALSRIFRVEYFCQVVGTRL